MLAVLRTYISVFLLIYFSFSNFPIQSKENSDDEDYGRKSKNIIQSSGDIEGPDILPSINPFTRSRYSTSILIDVAFASEFEHYMLPTVRPSAELQELHDMVISNLRLEIRSIKVNFIIQILSFRPGPQIKSGPRKDVTTNTVYARVNITQQNSSIIHPLLIVHISHCGHRGMLGNLSISDQVIYPEFVCSSNEVYCMPLCQRGRYCDGVPDCTGTHYDESASCPQCLYKRVQLTLSDDRTEFEAGETVRLNCALKAGPNCAADRLLGLNKQIRWQLPASAVLSTGPTRGLSSINLAVNASGIYGCSVGSARRSHNITVHIEPMVFLTRGAAGADILMLSETAGSSLYVWCNSSTITSTVFWQRKYPSITVPDPLVVRQFTTNKAELLLSNVDTKGSPHEYICVTKWGINHRRQTKRTLRLMVQCDRVRQFQCGSILSESRSSSSSASGNGLGGCIPLSEKCDMVKQCLDGSDERDCSFCKDELITTTPPVLTTLETGANVIVSCQSSSSHCRPLVWLRNGQLVGPATSGRIIVLEQSLFILNASVDSNGDYQCIHPVSRAQKTIRISIIPPPQVHLIPGGRFLKTTLGKTATMDCVTDVSYKPVWRGPENTGALPMGVHISSFGNGHSQLRLPRTTKDMAGEYACEVPWGHTLKRLVRISVTVVVDGAKCSDGQRPCTDETMCVPSDLWCDGQRHCTDGSDEKACEQCKNGFVFVKPTALTVFNRQSVEVICYHHRDCAPVSWRSLNPPGRLLSSANQSRDLQNDAGSLVLYNSILRLERVSANMSGAYECFSGRKSSKFQLTVLEKIEMKLLNNLGYIFVEYNEEVQADCQTNYGTPKWRKRDMSPLFSIHGAHQSLLNMKTARLTITKPRYDARGYYVCYVRLPNSEKEIASKMMFVHVKDLVCKKDQIMCDKNTKCVSKPKMCDGNADCNDGADEQNCSKCGLRIEPTHLVVTTGGFGSFRCISSPDCLPVQWVIDSINNDSDTFERQDTNLYVINPNLRQSTNITCVSGPSKVIGSQNQKTARAILTVTELQLRLDSAVAPLNPVTYVKVGHTQRVGCTSNLGRPRWVYPPAATAQPLGVLYQETREQGKGATAFLSMKNLHANASGTYVCAVTFAQETKQISFVIKVV